MDHKWGRSIYEEGLGGFGATLAARVLTGFWTGMWLTNRSSAGAVVLVQVPLLEEAPYIFWTGFYEPPDAHFPYGFDVEPDVHM